MKNSADTIGNRTCDLSNCSAVPQPTAPPRGNDDALFETYELLIYGNIQYTDNTCQNVLKLTTNCIKKKIPLLLLLSVFFYCTGKLIHTITKQINPYTGLDRPKGL